MDPATMMMIASIASAGAGALTGSGPQQGSSFNKQQKGGINDLLNMVNQRGGAPDITQNQNYGQGQDWLSMLFNDPNFFDAFEAPIQRNFEENTVPDLANRFASQGSGGSLGSTGFRNQLGREASTLHEKIAALRGGMQQQGVNQGLQYAQQPFNNIMQMYNQALQQPVNNQYNPASTGGWGSLAAPLAQGAVQAYGNQSSGNNQQNNNNGGGYAAGWDNQFRQTGVPGQYPGTY